jgi:hypothetical protein
VKIVTIKRGEDRFVQVLEGLIPAKGDRPPNERRRFNITLKRYWTSDLLRRGITLLVVRLTGIGPPAGGPES